MQRELHGGAPIKKPAEAGLCASLQGLCSGYIYLLKINIQTDKIGSNTTKANAAAKNNFT